MVTVDVDVYKGPLANHRDVQVQQAASSAIAAKPLLGKLRYLLEGKAQIRLRREHGARVDIPLETLRDNDDFVEAKSFASSDAAFVNKLLALYADESEKGEIANFYNGRNNALTSLLGQKGIDRAGIERSLGPPTTQPSIADEKIKARGGIKLGLESLLTAYLAKKSELERIHEVNHPGRLPPVEHFHEQSELFDALLLFSQKILFVANNSILIREDKGVKELLIEAPVAFVAGRGFDADPNASANILQAVGNSILVQLNELREDAQHRDDQLAKGPQEFAASLAAGSPGAARLLGGLAHSLDLSLDDFSKPFDPKKLSRFGLKDEQSALREAASRLDTAKARRDSAQTAAEEKNIQQIAASDALALISGTPEGDALVPGGNAVREGQAPVTPADLLDQLANAAAAAIYSTAAADGKKRGRLDHLRNLLVVWKENWLSPASAPATPPTRAESLAKLNSHANQEAATAKLQEDQARQGLESANAALKPAEEARASAQKAFESRQTELEQKYTNARDAIRDVAPEVVFPNGSHVDGPTPAPAVVRDRLLTLLRERSADAKDEADRHKWNDAITVVNDWDAPAARATLAPQNNPESQQDTRTAKAVLDDLIATLRHEHIEAVRENGKDSPAARRFEEALEIAYNQRSGMIYIRPASAYLRTSFPATSFQRDARIGWENSLFRHSLRQIPIVGELLTNGDQRRLRTLLELDKQYWQNINTIRVAGGGNTNYAIVKDDIGNWTVKNYSADPKDIIKSAQGLAMFGLGPALGAPGLLAAAAEQDLAAGLMAGKEKPEEAAKKLEAVKKAEAGATNTDAKKPAATQPTDPKPPLNVGNKSVVLGQQLAASKQTYQTATVEDLKSVKSSPDELKGAIAGAWDKDEMIKKAEGAAGDFKKLLETAAATLSKNMGELKTDATSEGDTIIAALRLQKQFHGELSAKLAEYTATQTKAIGDASTNKDAPAAAPLPAAPGVEAPPAGPPIVKPEDIIKEANAKIDAAKAARASATRIVRTAMLDLIQRRENAVEKYQVQLDLIDQTQAN